MDDKNTEKKESAAPEQTEKVYSKPSFKKKSDIVSDAEFAGTSTAVS